MILAYPIRWLLLRLAMLGLLGVAASSVAAPAVTVAEPRVRAALTFNFLKQTEWPTPLGNELLLCVAASDLVLGNAMEALDGRSVGTRRVQVGKYHRAAGCHAVYVDTRQDWDRMGERAAPPTALTIGAYPGFLRDGGMIEMLREGDHVGFDVDTAAAQRAGLRFQPQLLRLSRSGAGTVWIALSDTGAAHAEAAAAIKAEVGRAGAASAEVRPWADFLGAVLPPRLIVAVGNNARRGLLDVTGKTPLLAVMVAPLPPEQAKVARDYSAVHLAQPATRQLAAVRLALPDSIRIGMLFGPDSQREEPTFRRATEAAGLKFASGHVGNAESLGNILQQTLEDSDLLLALPDPAIYNNASALNIFTACYRRRLPLVGFSPAYVKAGALYSLYSTPTQLGRQAGEIARAYLAGQPLPPPQSPRDFVIEVNPEVARSLGIPLSAEDGEALAAKVRAQEGRR